VSSAQIMTPTPMTIKARLISRNGLSFIGASLPQH
jgi:hypothetical protein